MDCKYMQELIKQYGDAFYILDSKQFAENFKELKKAFTDIYPNFNIAYSYKTNYTPKLCKIVNELGGFAEVVSEMEVEIAQRIGVSPERIVWNGPAKNMQKAEELLLQGGSINMDSVYELAAVREIAAKHPKQLLKVGIRCNFEIGDNVISRFGFDVNSEEFEEAIDFIKNTSNVCFEELQCHFATRRLDTWEPRAKGMLALLDRIGIMPAKVDLGGGLFGKMADSLKAQFDSSIPTYEEYAKVVAPLFAERFLAADGTLLPGAPMLVIEPGSALVGDCMKFACRVKSIKNVRGKAIASLIGSIYNINPTLNTKNPPLEVFELGNDRAFYQDLDFGGFTCIESDYLYRHYQGSLAVGDVVVFGNAGSYSVVLKPPFILPNFPMLDLGGEKPEVVKEKECFDDLFHTFHF